MSEKITWKRSQSPLTSLKDHQNDASTKGKISGKWYWELDFTKSEDDYFLFGINGGALGTMDYNTPNSAYIYFQGGTYGSIKGQPKTFSFTREDDLAVLLNLEEGVVQFIKNGEKSIKYSSPFIANSNLEKFPAISYGTSGRGATCLANFGADPFKYYTKELREQGYLPYDLDNAHGHNLGEQNKYLFRKDNIIYQPTEEGAEEIPNAILNKELFEEYGVEDLGMIVGFDREVILMGEEVEIFDSRGVIYPKNLFGLKNLRFENDGELNEGDVLEIEHNPFPQKIELGAGKYIFKLGGSKGYDRLGGLGAEVKGEIEFLSPTSIYTSLPSGASESADIYISEPTRLNLIASSGGGGGSSFISGHEGCDALDENGVHTGQPIHHSGIKFINTSIESKNDRPNFIEIKLVELYPERDFLIKEDNKILGYKEKENLIVEVNEENYHHYAFSTSDLARLIEEGRLNLERQNILSLYNRESLLLRGDKFLEGEILVSQDLNKENDPIAKAKGYLSPQLIKPLRDLPLFKVKEIKDMRIKAIDPKKLIKIICSIDGGDTWKTYREGKLVDVDVDSVEDIRAKGLTVDEFNAISVNWNDILFTTNKLRFAYFLDLEDINDESHLDDLFVTIDMYGYWQSEIQEEDFDYYYTNQNLVIEFYKNGTYKINYSK